MNSIPQVSKAGTYAERRHPTGRTPYASHAPNAAELTYHRGMAHNNSTSYAMIINRFGGPEEFTQVPRTPAEPGPGEILVKTTAIGANPLAVSYTHLTLPTID